MFTTRKRGRTAAVFGVVAGLLLSTAAAASAVPEAPIPTIDPNKRGEITITKLVNADKDHGIGNGLEIDPLPLGARPIEGVKYTVERITGFDFDGNGVLTAGPGGAEDERIDLTTAKGWQNAAALTVQMLYSPTALMAKVGAQSTLTGSNGEVTFEDLDLGLYLVTETAWPSNVDLDSDGVGDVVPRTNPFLITVPMTDPANLDAWMYHVHVYPKNDMMSLVKTIVDEEAAFLGDYVTFEVKTLLPADVSDMTSLTFTDVLDERLGFTLDDENFWFGFAPPAYPATSALGDVDFDDATNTLTVVYDNDYLSAHAGNEVGFTFRAKVTSVGADGIITNVANYQITTADGTTPGKSNEVVTKWGGLGIGKVDENEDPLTGATFCLARTEARALAGYCDYEAVESAATPGLHLFTAVRLSNFENDAAIAGPEDYQTYWLFESKAPQGYELMAKPLEVVVTSMADGDFDYTVINVPHNAGFELPAVGGNRAVLPILAAVIAAGGVVWLIRSRREPKA